MLIEIPVDIDPAVVSSSPRATQKGSTARAEKEGTMAPAAPPKKDVFPGFTALSDQVFVSKPPAETESQTVDDDPTHPTVVAIISWGDAAPKHVTKYADGYKKLYPRARQVVVLSPIFQAISSDLPSRTKAMTPFVEGLFPSGSTPEDHGRERVLVQAMSNTGGINYAAALNAYKERHPGATMPHHLLVLDSTPGTPYLSARNLGLWSRAMALGTAKWFPWPFVVTQGIWGGFLVANRTFELVTRREAASVFSNFATNNPEYATLDAHRLYMFSKEDELIWWGDIEDHLERATTVGYVCEKEVFEGTGHVDHMRKFPERYWDLVEKAWRRRRQALSSAS